jgi:hypothetical protein
MSIRRVCARAAVLLPGLLLAAQACGQRSYVRGTAAPARLRSGAQVNGLSIVFVDRDLPRILTNGIAYTAVDVVMAQCHGGGFLPFLSNNPPAADWTFCSASAPAEMARGVGAQLAGALYVDNFTRPWREDAQRTPPAGMRQHFRTAVNGNQNPAIIKDRYAPPTSPLLSILIPPPVFRRPAPDSYYLVSGSLNGQLGTYVFVPDPPNNRSGWVQVEQIAPGNFWRVAGPNGFGIAQPNTPFPQQAQRLVEEHPQYGSAGVNSDNRTLALPSPNTNNVQQYAILVQWDRPDKPAFAANLARMYFTLTNVYQVSTDNIVVLFNNGRFGASSNIPALNLQPGPLGALSENLNPFPIDGPTGRDTTGTNFVFDQAVAGRLFKQSGVPGFPPTNANPRLLVYFTGHGQRGFISGATRLTYRGDPTLGVHLLAPSSLDSTGAVSTDGFNAAGESAEALTSYLATSSDADPSSDSALLSNTNNVLDAFQGPMDLIQISTTKLIPSGVQLSINGCSDPAWQPLLPVTDPNATVYDLDPLVPGLLTNTYTYQVLVDNMVLYGAATNGGPAEIDLEFANVDVADFDPNLVSAVVVRGAEQEVAYITDDVTAANTFTPQNLDGGLLLSWPVGLTNYWIQQNPDLTTTNWVAITNVNTSLPELTGLPDPALPMGTNWAFFPYNASQMFYRLRPSQ